jgi:hypothetical protein
MKKLFFILVLTLLAGKSVLAQNSSEWVYFQNETTGNIHAYLSDDQDNQVVFAHGTLLACDGTTLTGWSIAYDQTYDDLVPYMLNVLQGGEIPEFMPLELGQFLQNYSHLHSNVYCTYLPVISN